MTAQDREELRADAEERDHHLRAPRSSSAKWPAALAVPVIAALAFWWWSSQRHESAPPAPRVASAPAVEAANPAASAPAFPLDTANSTPLSVADIEPALAELFGARAIAAFLELADFPRRVVATIDNLARSHAPVAVWPVRPTPGRFTVEKGPRGTVIAPTNATRYEAFVRFVDSVDATRAVMLYRRMYPLLEQAYRELGFSGRYLNDRVVEVIDVLLKTPEPQHAPVVQLTEVRGPLPSVRPWVRYEFVDPQLEALTAGQKILVRIGLANERRLKHKLFEVRELIAPGIRSSVAR